MPRKITLKSIKAKHTAHPYSRKSTQIQRSIHRMNKMQQVKQYHQSIHDKRCEKMIYFKYGMDEEKKSLTKEEFHELIDSYIQRNDTEIQELDEKRRNNPKSTRQDVLEIMRRKELDEYYTAGIDVPDLTNEANVKVMRSWQGDYASMDRIKTIRMKKE